MPTTYTVTGRWPFPLDMLRYDEAQPASDVDRELIERASAEHLPSKDHPLQWTITLVSERKPFFLSTNCAERWKSYGWRSSLDVTAEQHPKVPTPAATVDLTVRLPAAEAEALALLCGGLSLPLIARAGLNVPQCDKALSAAVRVRHALETQKQMQEPGHG